MIVKSTATTRVTAEDAQRIGKDFVADHLGDQISVGTPWHIVSSLRSAWVVPLILTSPGYGAVGIVGALIVDEEHGAINAWTTKDEIEANIARLTQTKATELESAFERALARNAA